MLSDEQIKELTNEVNDLFRERNYFKTIMDDCSHMSEEVYSEHDGDQKYKDGTDFFYPLIDEYERGTIYWNSKQKEYSIPSPDKRCDDEYQDFKCLICCKKETEPKFFKDYTFDSIGSPAKQLYYYKDRDSEDSLLRLSGDTLFDFGQLINHVADKKDALDRLKNPSLQPLINTFSKASALPGNYIFWRVVGPGKGINSAHGGQWPIAGDRFDLALVALRQWFAESDGDAKNRDSNVSELLEAFDDEKKEEKAKYPLFSKEGDSDHWKDFVNFFELKGSFVDDDYRVYNQVSNPFEEEMEVFPDKNKDWDGKLRKSWSELEPGEGIPSEIENYLINGIKTIIKRTERLNEVLHRA